MKLTILVDNNTFIGKYYLGEPGLSYYIEDEGVKILLDTGYSDIYLKNAESMGIDLSDVDKVIISHGHNDHTGGLPFFPFEGKKKELIATSEIFLERRKNGRKLSCPLSLIEAAQRFELKFSDEPVKISPNITFLGKIPRKNDFENKIPVGECYENGLWQDDFIKDDTALFYKSSDGIYVITACSHSGICNIISYAKEASGCSNVKGVIGGFHLQGINPEFERKTAEFLKNENIPELYPCHCTALKAKCYVNDVCPIKEAGVGLTIEW